MSFGALQKLMRRPGVDRDPSCNPFGDTPLGSRTSLPLARDDASVSNGDPSSRRAALGRMRHLEATLTGAPATSSGDGFNTAFSPVLTSPAIAVSSPIFRPRVT